MNDDTRQALEKIYASLSSNNEGLDTHIDELKRALAPEKTVTVETARLVQPNREGRKTMKAYFKKRGVDVEFAS